MPDRHHRVCLDILRQTRNLNVNLIGLTPISKVTADLRSIYTEITNIAIRFRWQEITFHRLVIARQPPASLR